MAESAEKNTNKLIAIIAAVVLTIAAAVVAIILINKNKGEVLNDDFFKTSDSKVVLSFDLSSSAGTTTGPVAKKMHQVFTVNGDKITGLKVYTEYEDEAAAKEADSRPEVEEAVKNGQALDHKVNGKYLVASMPESAYAGATVEQLRASAETLEKSINETMKQQQAQQQEAQQQEAQAQEQATEETGATEEAVEQVSADEE